MIWMRPLAWIAGVLFSLVLPAAGVVWLAGGLLFLIAAALLLWALYRSTELRDACQCALLFVLAAFFCFWRISSGLDEIKQCAARDYSQPIQGVYAGLPSKYRNGWQSRFILPDEGQLLVRGEGLAPVPGTGDLLYLRPLATGTEQRSWLLRQRICGLAQVQGAGVYEQQEHLSLSARLARMRLALSEAVAQVLTPAQAGAILRTVTLGDSSGLERQTWERFKRTGTIHLLVISGLHIGLAALVGGLAVSWLVGRLLPGLLRLPLADTRWLAACLTAIAYACMAGFTVSVRRAVTMLLLAALLAFSRRRTSALPLSLLYILATLLLLDPLTALAPGLWLSFAGVGILLLYSRWQLAKNTGWRQRFWHHLRFFFSAQLVISLALLPVLLLSNVQSSLLSLPANLVAVPLLGLGTVPLGLLGVSLVPLSPLLASWILQPALLCAEWAYLWVSWLAALPVVQITPGHTGLLLLLLLASLLLLSPPGMPGRRLWPFVLLCALVAIPSQQRGLELQLNNRGDWVHGALSLDGRRMRLNFSWQGLRLQLVSEGDRAAAVGCPVLHWQRQGLALHSVPAGAGCALVLQADGSRTLLSGQMSTSAQEALFQRLKRSEKESYDLLVSPAVAPHSYGLLSLLKPQRAVLLGEASQEAEERYGWFGIPVHKSSGIQLFCHSDGVHPLRCRQHFQFWWQQPLFLPESKGDTRL